MALSLYLLSFSLDMALYLHIILSLYHFLLLSATYGLVASDPVVVHHRHQQVHALDTSRL